MTDGPLDHRTVEEILARAADPSAYEAWQSRAQATGWCRHPVRLIGTSQSYDADQGELVRSFSSVDLPDGVLLKACGQRRATRCPSCSATYRSDAFQLVAAGLRGGKGLPESLADHPAVFVTLTAPSFGPVHSTRAAGADSRPCRPDANGSCSHRIAKACLARHDPDDPDVGQPICAGCFDYAGAVIWNATVGELWRRTTIAVRRSLASLAGISAANLRGVVRLSFTKVVEYQRRGVVHVHAVARLDDATDPADPPASPFDVGLLTLAVLRTAATTAAPFPATSGISGSARWGAQVEVLPIGTDSRAPGAVAGYLAKYVTKSTDAGGVLDRRLKPGDLDDLDGRCSPHLARMVRTAWELGARPELEHLRLRAWAHTLGFRGHWLTKSRAYSTTFAALRSARAEWRAARASAAADDRPTVAVGEWRFGGQGWTTSGDALLAVTAAAEAAEARRIAREERRSGSLTGTGQHVEESDGDQP